MRPCNVPQRAESPTPALPAESTDIIPLHLTAPRSRTIGQTRSLPPPVSGSEAMPPGDWCKLIMNAPFQFSVALQGRSLKGNLLGRLLRMQGQNEPVIRPGKRYDWDAMKFFSMINSSLANVEAVVMQCVGRVITDPELQCEHCARGKGPFNFCVVVDGIKECANCHWGKMDLRCSVNTGAPEPEFHLKSKKLYTKEELKALEDEVKELYRERSKVRAMNGKHRKELRNIADSVSDALLEFRKWTTDSLSPEERQREQKNREFLGNLYLSILGLVKSLSEGEEMVDDILDRYHDRSRA
ncbi:hypothetical protein N7528_003438 [Penicillium herquei]|nr:hypothetical protein N7528_003438 [Penicillium herquei]